METRDIVHICKKEKFASFGDSINPDIVSTDAKGNLVTFRTDVDEYMWSGKLEELLKLLGIKFRIGTFRLNLVDPPGSADFKHDQRGKSVTCYLKKGNEGLIAPLTEFVLKNIYDRDVWTGFAKNGQELKTKRARK